jgi:hypothetical protein
VRRAGHRAAAGWIGGACVATAFAAATWPADASAQQYLIGADLGLSSGVEGGGAGLARARTRLRLGADLRIDESPDDILELAALAELEPRSGFGADVRYARAASDRFFVDAGLLAILAPASLYGACAGLTYRLPISKRTQITLGPEVDLYFLGTDLPDGTVIWEMRIQAGVRVDL